MPSGAKIVRFERAEDELGVEWRLGGVGDSSFVPSSRRDSIAIITQITLAMIPCIFQISEDNFRDLVAMDCIRYEESIYIRKRMSHLSHICCNVSLTWLRAVKRPWSDKDVTRMMHVGRDCLFFAGSYIRSRFFWHDIYLELGRYVIIRM